MGAGNGLLLGGKAALVTIGVLRAIRQRGPDAALDGDIGVGLRVFGHGPIMETDDVFIANHAGVAAGFEADLGIRSGSKCLAGLQEDWTIEVIRLIAFRQKCGVIFVERCLDGTIPDLACDFA